jgi:carbon storage regulator
MLVLTRKLGEKLVIDGNIIITVVDAGGGKIRLGIDAPPHVRVFREELLASDQQFDEPALVSTRPAPVRPQIASPVPRSARFRDQLRSLRRIPR